MTCEEYQEQVSQYIDGELDDKESGALFKHLSTCGECRSFLRSALELRSKIHDEMLMEAENQRHAQPGRITTAFTLPLVALLVAFFLFLGIAQLSSNGQYNQFSNQANTELSLPVPRANPF